MAKIRTTHTGSLHRPKALVPMVTAREAGEEVPGVEAAVTEAVRDVVAEQVAAGIDIVNDGEQGKRTYASYVIERFTGFEPGLSHRRTYRDLEDFPDFAEVLATLEPERGVVQLPACTSAVTVRDPHAVHRDIADLSAAAAAAGIGPDRIFMSAISPGTVAVFMDNNFYATKEEYLGALADALRDEYRAIVDAGFTLQIDSPDLAMMHGEMFRSSGIDDIRRDIAISVDALNAATDGLPPEQVRVHLCWGNLESPHTHDVPLAEIIDLIVQANPAGIALEASNPRHAHEWQVFEEFKLPDDKYLLPGVLDTTTNFVEHPELVAQRLRNYTNILGNDRVIATTDCGFGTHAGRNRVSASVAWGKLRSMVEGAAIASR